MAHYHTSDAWYQAGAWDTVQDSTAFGVDVDTVFFHGGYDIGFEAEDLEPWGEYALSFVRYEDGTGDRFRIIQFEKSHVQIWIGDRLGDDDARALLHATAPAILDADTAELERLADRMMTSKTHFDARPAGEHHEARTAMWGYGASYSRPEYERLYAALGGLHAMQVETHLDATLHLPISGQVRMHSQGWTFHLETNLLRVTDGGGLLWVAPTDHLQYVEKSRLAISDDTATRNLNALLGRLALGSPDHDWTWQTETVTYSAGD